MSEKKYLDQSGLEHVWSKLKETFLNKAGGTINSTSGIPLRVTYSGTDIAPYAFIEVGGSGAKNNLAFTDTSITKYGTTQGNGVTLAWPSSTSSYTLTLPEKNGTLATLSDISSGGSGSAITMYRHMIYCAVGQNYDSLCLVVVNKDPLSLNTNATTKLNISSTTYWRDSYILGGSYNDTPIIGFIDHPAAGVGFLTITADGKAEILSCSSWTWITGGDTVTEI